MGCFSMTSYIGITHYTKDAVFGPPCTSVYQPKYQSANNKYYRSYTDQHTSSALNYAAPPMPAPTAYQVVLPDMGK